MLNREINLLPEETFLKRKETKRRKKSIFSLTFVIILIFSSLTLGAFVYGYFLNSKTSQISEKVKIEEEKIEEMREKESLLLFIKTKVLSMQEILATRPLYESQLEGLDLISGLTTASDSTLKSYSFTGNNLDFTLLIPNSTAVEKFIDDLVEENNRTPAFSALQVDSVKLQEEGGYELSLEAALLN